MYIIRSDNTITRKLYLIQSDDNETIYMGTKAPGFHKSGKGIPDIVHPLTTANMISTQSIAVIYWVVAVYEDDFFSSSLT